jgi:hypothetical protein
MMSELYIESKGIDNRIKEYLENNDVEYEEVFTLSFLYDVRDYKLVKFDEPYPSEEDEYKSGLVINSYAVDSFYKNATKDKKVFIYETRSIPNDEQNVGIVRCCIIDKN